ncbi:hypothetical protein HN031_03040 [Nocardioides sp. zg-1308]|uniref:hypothetical protein n=1 Tax=Nocardioides sp. zg-1308 TaxID=2736253 RepID=UPI00155307AF|nr:hypothetical protein [Nocardioides sp. zg-1308]NPD03657.1 hypothetical protein [Nocardioides sp. zg-1308]
MSTLQVGTRALAGLATVLLLAGCGGEGQAPDEATGSSPVSSSGSPSAPPTSQAPGDGHEDGPDGSSSPGPDATAEAPTGSASVSPDPSAEAGEEPGSDEESQDATSQEDGSAGLEMPEEPEPEVTSLSELLEEVGSAPLVAEPLPAAASATGRLVTRFPAVLRPTRAARVESSSISPSGDRLQVSLVASTSLDPAEVLMSYRTRLARRGLTELAAPAAAAGSQAVAFRRGRSTVTVTATPEGSRTSYSVHASLRAGGA